MTDLEVVNRALTFLAVDAISSLDNNGKVARVMSGLLPDTKRTVLSEFPWTFALRVDPLVAATTEPAPGFAHCFEYPGAALAVRRVYPKTEFRVIGPVIVANVTSGHVEYIADVQDLSEWPATVLECLATRLASDAALQLTGAGTLMSALMEKYMLLARRATQNSVVEERLPPPQATHYIDVRH